MINRVFNNASTGTYCSFWRFPSGFHRLHRCLPTRWRVLGNPIHFPNRALVHEDSVKRRSSCEAIDGGQPAARNDPPKKAGNLCTGKGVSAKHRSDLEETNHGSYKTNQAKNANASNDDPAQLILRDALHIRGESMELPWQWKVKSGW